VSKPINVRVNIRLHQNDRAKFIGCFENHNQAVKSLTLYLTDLAEGKIDFADLLGFENKVILRKDHSLVQPSIPLETVEGLYKLCEHHECKLTDMVEKLVYYVIKEKQGD
jgi:hypothetical protein